MKPALLSVVFLFPLCGSGQPSQPPPSGLPLLETREIRLTFDVRNQAGAPAIGSLEQGDAASGWLGEWGIELAGVDLKLSLTLERQKMAAYYYDIPEIRLEGAGGIWRRPTPGDLSPDRRLEGGKPGRLVWENALEEALDPGRTHTLVLTVRLFGYGGIDCGQPPTFSFYDQLPHYIVGAVGAGLIAVGQASRQNAKEAYATYEQFQQNWRESNGQDDRYSRLNAQGALVEAKREREDSRALITAGVALLTVDAIWGYVRWQQYRRRKKEYDIKCNKDKEPSLRPVFQLPGGSAGTGSVGVNLTIRF